jgi:O-6-methylguanine DNA methyltransferase
MIEVCVKNVGGVWFGVGYEGEMVYATTFAFSEAEALKSLRGSLPKGVAFQRSSRSSSFSDGVIGVIKDVYDGKDVSRSFSFCMEHLSDFARRVLDAVLLVPPGYVVSYGGVAKAVGGSSRAVGRVMATNPFAPVCPCHRVVGSDFSLVGYGGGPDVKLAFLRRERRGFSCRKEVPVDGKRLVLYPVEFVLRRFDGDKR